MKKRNLWLVGVLAAGVVALFAFVPKQKTNNETIMGAWQQKEDGAEDVLLIMDGYCTQTRYEKDEKKFVFSRGGKVTTNGNNFTLSIEFDTEQKSNVGQSFQGAYEIDGDEPTITLGGEKETWKRVDDGKAPLAGVWRITDRMQDGKLTPIHQTGPRKTLKILTGTRFQWAAINPETKEFSGSGGGTYTFENGQYTENIEFFSRDNSRVGSSLSFDGKLEGGKWHHSGKSSRGDAIYEVWGRVK